MSTADLMQQARAALRAGELPQARRALRQVVHADPQNHAAWLLLAQATENPKTAAEYVRRAQALRPDSPLVQQARLQENRPTTAHSRRRWAVLLAALLLASLLGLAYGRQAWAQFSAQRLEPAMQTAAVARAATPVLLEQPAATTIALIPLAASNTVAQEPTATAVPTTTPAPATAVPTSTAVTQAPLATVAVEAGLPQAIRQGMSLEALPADGRADALAPALAEDEPLEEAADQPASASPEETEGSIRDAALPAPEEATSYPANTYDSLAAAARATGERWIDVNLSTQTLVAYEGETPVFSTLVSSGLANFPTVTGEFRTWLKYESQDMNGYLLGYDYYLPAVPYVMYFYEDYAIHGAYWHNNFGIPQSHGCVNVSPTDAGWLFNWAPIGTVVSVHH